MNNVMIGVSASPVTDPWVGTSSPTTRTADAISSYQDTFQRSATPQLTAPAPRQPLVATNAISASSTPPPTAENKPADSHPATPVNSLAQGHPTATDTPATSAPVSTARTALTSAGTTPPTPAVTGTPHPTPAPAHPAPASAGASTTTPATTGTPHPTPAPARTVPASAGAPTTTPTTTGTSSALGFQIAGAIIADKGAALSFGHTYSGLTTASHEPAQPAQLPSTPGSPQSNVSKPDVPQPGSPQSSVPKPDVPQPDSPQSSTTQSGLDQPHQSRLPSDSTQPSPSARTRRTHSARASAGQDEVCCPAGTHRAKAARTKTPVGECENTAADMELRQQDQLHAEEVFARMQAERRLHIAKLQAIVANLQTEIQRIFEEVALRRQKIHDDLMEKWEKTMFA